MRARVRVCARARAVTSLGGCNYSFKLACHTHTHAMVRTVSSEAVITIQLGDRKITSCPIICQRVTDGWRGLEV